MELPVVPVPQDVLLSPSQVAEVLSQDAVSSRIMAEANFPKPGDLVGVRLNLNVLKSTGVAIQTLHQATNSIGCKRNQGFYGGKACGYAQAVHLKNAFFNVQQGARENIAVTTCLWTRTVMQSILPKKWWCWGTASTPGVWATTPN